MRITIKGTIYTLDTENKDFQKGDKLLQYYNCLGVEDWAIVEVKGEKEAKFHRIVSDTYKILEEVEDKSVEKE